MIEELKRLEDLPPWDWPEGAGQLILRVLRDDKAPEADRLLAAGLAGQNPGMDDEQAEALLAVAQADAAPPELRGRAAIALGPILEEVDTEGFDYPDDLPITEETFEILVESLRLIYADQSVPKEARRRVLEAAVRAPRVWQGDAVAAAYASDDPDWKVTAVFCMKYVRGFDEQILESLTSPNTDVAYEAVSAAGEWGIEKAWPHIRQLLTATSTPKSLLIAAIYASPTVNRKEAPPVLTMLELSKDVEVSDAATEALGIAEEDPDDDGEEECSLCDELDEDF